MSNIYVCRAGVARLDRAKTLYLGTNKQVQFSCCVKIIWNLKKHCVAFLKTYVLEVVINNEAIVASMTDALLAWNGVLKGRARV